jgi:3-oxoacyl-[acyl-carrier-protein] synthase III
VNLTFHGKRLSGLVTVLPANERRFLDDMKNFDFPESRSLKLKEVMGYDRHRVVTEGTCISDLAVFGLNWLFEQRLLDRQEFDALILVTQTPDYFMPPTSSVIQGRLELKDDLFCLDINQGCAGFVIGLIQAFLLLEQPAIRKVVLLNGDVISRRVSIKDRNSYPLVGDALSITLIERTAADVDPGPPIHANLKMDGRRREALMIPAGGFRLPSSTETAQLRDVGDNNARSQNDLVMDGTAVFNFVQTEVPPMVELLLASAGVDREKIDYFLFHQPNRFMLQKLADKMKVPYAKMPSNVVERFGNSSGATIPTAIALNLGPTLRERRLTVCLAGFGVGLTWSSMLLPLGPLDFCQLVDY